MTHLWLARTLKLFLTGIWLFTACLVDTPHTLRLSTPTADLHPSEVAVQEIILSGPVSSRSAEISGMAWYQDTLVLLPQYPHRFGKNGLGVLFALDKSLLLSYIQGSQTEVLSPTEIVFDDGGLRKVIQGFEGFEAITFNGEQVYLTIEASPHNKMKGYIVSGIIKNDQSGISLDPGTLSEIPLQKNINNLSDEALLIYNEMILSFYEANGREVNPFPVAHQFDPSLVYQDGLPFPNIEYRITDSTPPDDMGFFWVINSYFPLDERKLKPQEDDLSERYGQGLTHAENLTVERLIQLQIQEGAVHIVDQPPVQLFLEGDIAPRNWEAIALLDNLGFLLATDKFPRTILGFVPFKFSK